MPSGPVVITEVTVLLDCDDTFIAEVPAIEQLFHVNLTFFSFHCNSNQYYYLPVAVVTMLESFDSCVNSAAEC